MFAVFGKSRLCNDQQQGQSLQVCGLNFPNPCFLQGQLYFHKLENLQIYLCTHHKEEQKILYIQMQFNNYDLIEYLNFQAFLDKTNKIT